MNVRLYVWQRLTAAAMVPLIAIHLFVILYAMNGGLTAAEILGRTKGSVLWALFYGAFVMLAAIHGAIGVRSVAKDWARLEERKLDIVMWALGVLLLLTGLRAVYAVIFPGGL